MKDEEAKQSLKDMITASEKSFDHVWMLEIEHNFSHLGNKEVSMIKQYVGSIINVIRTDANACLDRVLRQRNAGMSQQQILEKQNLINCIAHLVGQHCSSSLDPSQGLDSMAIEANAQAMRLLRDYGILDIKVDDGRRVMGKFKQVQQ